MTILADSSFIYALYNNNEIKHPDALSLARSTTEEFLIPYVVLPEVGYLFNRDLGYRGVQYFLTLFSETDAELVSLEARDVMRMAEIADQYDTAAFDIVDCCIMAQAERLNICRIATFDRRDFSIYRPPHCDHLTLLP